MGQLLLQIPPSHAVTGWGFPGSASGKEPACQGRRTKRPKRTKGSIPGLGRSSRGEHGNPLHCSCLENPMDRGFWWTAVPTVSQGQTRLKQLSMHRHCHTSCNYVYFSLRSSLCLIPRIQSTVNFYSDEYMWEYH